MVQRIQHRRDTTANWQAANPVLASGEFGVELSNTTGAVVGVRMGDGTTAWNALDRLATLADVAGLQAALDSKETPARAQARVDQALSAIAELAVRQWIDDIERIGVSEQAKGWSGEAFLIGDDRVESSTMPIQRGAGALTGGWANLPADGDLERIVTLKPVDLPAPASRIFLLADDDLDARPNTTLPTFTRASTAYLNGVEVASGVPRYPYGRNLLSLDASTFDSSLGGWANNVAATPSVSSEQAYEGSTSMRIATAAHIYFSRVILRPSVKPNTTYTVSAYGRAASNYGRTWFFQVASQGATTTGGGDQVLTSGEWKRMTHTFTTGPNATSIDFFIQTNTPVAGEVFYFDAIQLEEGSTASPWRPGGPSAVLIEEGTTNLLTLNQSNGSEDGTMTGFDIQNGAAISSSTEQKWEGTRSVKVVPSTTAFTGLSFGVGGLVVDTVYTASAWVFSPAAQTIQFAPDFITSSVDFSVPAGVWTRLAATGTHTAAKGTAFYIRSPVTTGTTFYVDGLQVEAKPYATSWHPGGATRNLDDLSAPAASFSPSEGTIEIDFYKSNETYSIAATNANDRVIFSFRGNMPGDTFMQWVVTQVDNTLFGDMMINGVGVTTVSNTQPVVSVGWHRLAIAYTRNELRVLLDGAVAAVYTLSAPYPTLNVPVRIGKGFNRTALNSPIAAVRFSNRARTDGELADHLAPLLTDADTTYLLDFANNLTPETRDTQSNYEGRLTTEGPWVPLVKGQTTSVPASGSKLQVRARASRTKRSMIGRINWLTAYATENPDEIN